MGEFIHFAEIGGIYIFEGNRGNVQNASLAERRWMPLKESCP